MEIGCFKNEGRATTAQISMAKETMSTWQLTLHGEARQILGQWE
jgi:hypothetical protein